MLCAWQFNVQLSKTMADSPAHYTRGKIEVWDFIRDQQLNYHLGNAVKYIARAGHKGIESQSLQHAYISDLKKAIHYLQNELDNQTTPSIRIPKGIRSEGDEDRFWKILTEDFDR
jgi:hypothetical protein